MIINPVWPFTKQPKKMGYVNNPFWTDSPADPNHHNPCGYWYSSPEAEDPALPTEAWDLYGMGGNGNNCLGILSGAFVNTLTEVDFDPIISVGCQNNNSLFISAFDYNLYAVGNQINGTIPGGAAEAYNYSIITKVDTEQWLLISEANDHTLLIKLDGTLWSCGQNSLGCLGIGEPASSTIYSLTQIGTESNWTFIHAGIFTSYAINSSQELYVWGYGGQGSLGLGDATSYNTPQLVSGDIKWQYVTAGKGFYNTASAIDTSGVLYGCGRDAQGGLGLGSTMYQRDSWTEATTALRFKKSQMNADGSFMSGYFLSLDGDLYVAGYDNPASNRLGIDGQPHTDLTLVPGGLTFKDIESHVVGGFALTDSGDLYQTGSFAGNNYSVWTHRDSGYDKIYSSTQNMWAMKSTVVWE